MVQILQPTDFVENDEILYRSIRANAYEYKNGKLQLLSIAFNDSMMQPSVDRAKLCGNDPSYTKKSLNDGVISFPAKLIRAIDTNSAGEQSEIIYILDVIASPSRKNKAHAHISSDPACQNVKHFEQKIKHSLKRTINNHLNWEIIPTFNQQSDVVLN